MHHRNVCCFSSWTSEDPRTAGLFLWKVQKGARTSVIIIRNFILVWFSTNPFCFPCSYGLCVWLCWLSSTCSRTPSWSLSHLVIWTSRTCTTSTTLECTLEDEVAPEHICLNLTINTRSFTEKKELRHGC